MKRYDRNAAFDCPKCGTLTGPDKVALNHWTGNDGVNHLWVACPRCLYQEEVLPLDAPAESAPDIA